MYWPTLPPLPLLLLLLCGSVPQVRLSFDGATHEKSFDAIGPREQPVSNSSAALCFVPPSSDVLYYTYYTVLLYYRSSSSSSSSGGGGGCKWFGRRCRCRCRCSCPPTFTAQWPPYPTIYNYSVIAQPHNLAVMRPVVSVQRDTWLHRSSKLPTTPWLDTVCPPLPPPRPCTGCV